jgi:phosphatidylinositol alpha-mannosyltransferase
MAAGKPIVASDIAGYATVVEDGAQGLLVKPKDDQALAAALLELINSPQRRRQMGARGRAHAESYSWNRVSGQILDYYEGLLEEREPGRLLRGE